MDVADLMPFASGLANIGLDSDDSGAVSQIVPYGLIHFLSGVLHDPIQGQSGIVRFVAGPTASVSYSTDGGSAYATSTLQTSLDDLYTNGPESFSDILINQTDLKFITEGGQWRVRSTDDLSSPISLSGQTPTPTQRDAGEIWLADPGVDNGWNELFVDTGSGIANVLTGSGIRAFASVTNQLTTKSGDRAVDILLDGIELSTTKGGDVTFAHDHSSGSDSIRILVDGLYACEYNFALDRSGINRQIGTGWVTLNGTEIAHSRSYSHHRTTAHGEGTAHAQFLFNAHVGDEVKLRVGTHTNSDLLNTDTLTTLADIGGTGDPTTRGAMFMQIRRVGARR